MITSAPTQAQVHPVSLEEFCERMQLRTPSGRLALKLGRRILERHFAVFRAGSRLWTTEQSLANVLLAPEAARVLNEPGKFYGTGREATIKAAMEVLTALIERGLVRVQAPALAGEIKVRREGAERSAA